MTYFVYILFSLKDKKLYTGFSMNLQQRIIYHNKGLNPSTAKRRPLKIIFYEAYLNKLDALRREQYLKTTDGKRGLKIILKETLKKLTNNA